MSLLFDQNLSRMLVGLLAANEEQAWNRFTSKRRSSAT